MSDHLKQTIADLENRLAKQLAEVAKTRETINRVSEVAGLPAPYPEVNEPEKVGGSIRADTFYGQPLHTAMRTYLEMRGKQRGAAVVKEIFEALKSGGFQFEQKDEDNSQRVMRITLTKNSLVFHKLPNGSYGLASWYPSVKANKISKKADAVTDDAGVDEPSEERTEESTEETE